jgi:hypothetical protein
MNKIKRYEVFLEAFLGFGKKKIAYLYSNRFRSMLKAISHNGDQVAQMLLYAENSNQVSDDITLIDIGSSDIMVSFIQLNRLQRFKDEETDTNVKSADLVDYVTNVWRKTDDKLDFKGWTQQRTEISVGRFANRVFEKSGKSITSQEVEKFVNSYKTRFKMMTDMESLFEFVKGEDIRKWYLEDNYQLIRGQLGNSCMKYNKCQSYLDIYTKNPDVCQLLILHGDNEDKIIGRALIWNLKDGRTYMDRQYCIVDADVILYREFAKKKGWLYYGDKSSEELEVQLGNYDYSSFPYMDSFVVYNQKEHLLSTEEGLWEPGKGWWSLQNTNGTYRSDDVVYSEYNDEWIPREDAIHCVDNDDWVRYDQAIYLEYKDEWVSQGCEDIAFSEYMDRYYYLDDCIYSEFINSYLLVDDSISVWVSSDDEVALPGSYGELTDTYEIDGERKECLKDAVMPNPFNSNWVFKKDTIHIYYCDSIKDYISEEDAKLRYLQIDTSNFKRVNMMSYIKSQVGKVDENKLYEHLKGIELTPELNIKVMEKVNDFFKTSYIYKWLQDNSEFRNEDKFQLIKLGIWFAYTNDDKNSGFKVAKEDRGRQFFVSENQEVFLDFVSKDVYNKVFDLALTWSTQTSFNSFVKAASLVTWNIIKDPEMRKIYIAMKA